MRSPTRQLNQLTSQLTRELFKNAKNFKEPSNSSTLNLSKRITDVLPHNHLKKLEQQGFHPKAKGHKIVLNALHIEGSPKISVGGSFTFDHQSSNMYGHRRKDKLFTVEIQIDVKSNQWPVHKQHYRQLHYKIAETLRHELEHARQPRTLTSYGNHLAKLEKNNLTHTSSIKWWTTYLAQPAETEAYVQSLVYLAKRLRIPVTNLINGELLTLQGWTQNLPDASPKNITDLSYHTRQQWYQYLEKRWPHLGPKWRLAGDPYATRETVKSEQPPEL